MYDIGKIVISDTILNKPEKLTDYKINIKIYKEGK